MKKIALFLVLVFTVAVLSGCNTVKGVGKDIKKLGEKIEESSDEVYDIRSNIDYYGGMI